MFEALVARVRYHIQKANFMGLKEAESTLLLGEAADAIEERDKYALTIQHEMMAEAESHVALVERLNKQIDYLQKQVAYWQAQLTKSMCGETLADLEKRRWIPVTERLPEMHDEVLICNDDYGKTWLGFATVAVWDGSDWVNAWDREGTICCVTHWMPLPEPPKEELA